jgi:hypothetical protein
MAAHFETFLTEKQANFLRRNLEQSIESMTALLFGLHRENARFLSPEVNAVLSEDEAEIAALQHVVDELMKFEAAHGWLSAPAEVVKAPDESDGEEASSEAA